MYLWTWLRHSGHTFGSFNRPCGKRPAGFFVSQHEGVDNCTPKPLEFVALCWLLCRERFTTLCNTKNVCGFPALRHTMQNAMPSAQNGPPRIKTKQNARLRMCGVSSAPL